MLPEQSTSPASIGSGAGPLPPCDEEGNVNGDGVGAINVADLTYLVDFLFFDGDPPPPCP